MLLAMLISDKLRFRFTIDYTVVQKVLIIFNQTCNANMPRLIGYNNWLKIAGSDTSASGWQMVEACKASLHSGTFGILKAEVTVQRGLTS
jgi:hypothetical protein